ncbi:hypothetical protein BDR04DRAFT_1160505 [Suillus decipiens]|nr:hypothetical protein BDR04DRAFT_1160505 [Suillus decipiens]
MSLSSPSPMPALRSSSPALEYVLLALEFLMPALGSPIPALGSLLPALGFLVPALGFLLPALGSLSPALKSPMPALKYVSTALKFPISALKSLTPALRSPLPLIQPITTVDALTSPDAMSNADENMPTESQTIPAPKPVKITIMNPLSTLALCAANMQFPPPPSPPVVVNPMLECTVQKVTTSTAEPLSKPKKAKGKMHPSQTKNRQKAYHHFIELDTYYTLQ